MNKIFCYNTIVSVQCTNVLLNFYFSLTSIFPVSELSFFHLWNSKIYNIGQYLWGCWLTKTKWEITDVKENFNTYATSTVWFEFGQFLNRIFVIRIRVNGALNCLWRAVSKQFCFDVRIHWVGRDGGPMHIKKSLRLQKYPVLCRRSLNKLPESAANRQWLFLKGQSCCVLKSGYTGGAQNKDFGAVSQTDLTRV